MTEPTPTPGSLPVCPRHPEQATGVRCTRCQRPVCAQCMVAAPVGFQCPECVAAAAATTRRATTPAGGTPIAKPAITYSLIGVTAAIFLLQFTVGINQTAGEWGMYPPAIAVGGEWWRLITHAFLHGSWLHVGFNMLVLFLLGPTLERILGHGRFLSLYVLAALGGGVASYIASDPFDFSVGASGAIFGLMGAFIVAGRRLRYDITQVVVLLGINVVIGFLSPGVDWRAHLGGLIVGAAVAAVFVLPARHHRALVQSAGLIGVVLVLAGLVAWRTAQINELLSPLG